MKRLRDNLALRRRSSRWMLLAVLTVVCAAVLQAQAPPGNTADTFIVQYRASRAAAIAAFTTYAQGLFRALALCEMAWVGVLLVLERTDLQGFTATLLRKLLVLFFFFWLLLNGANFSDLIMRSFTIYGQTAAGGPGGFGAGDIVWRGILAAENLLSGASLSAFLAGPAGAGAIVLCAVIVVVSFGVVALQYIMAMVESIICVSAGLLFLGFGGSSVTRPYVERFFALSVATGVKLMVLYIIIGIGETLTSGWAATALTISGLANPIRLIFDIMVGSLIYAVLAWGVPRFAASLLTGSSAFSGGDILQMSFSVAQAGIMVAGAAALAASGGAALVGGGAARLAAASQAGNAGSAGAAGSAGSAGAAGSSGSPGAPGAGMGFGGGSGRDGSGTSGGAPARPPAANTNGGTSNGSASGSTGTGSSGPGHSSAPSNGSTPVNRTVESGDRSTSGTSDGRGEAPRAPASAVRSENPSSPTHPAPPPLPPMGGAPSNSGGQPASPPAVNGKEGAGSLRAANAVTGQSAPSPAQPGAGLDAGTGANTPVSESEREGSAAGSKEQAAAPGTGSTSVSGATAPATPGVPPQVRPPGSKWAAVADGAKAVQSAAGVAYRGAYTAAQMSFFLQRIIPHDGGGHGSPPAANMHGE